MSVFLPVGSGLQLRRYLRLCGMALLCLAAAVSLVAGIRKELHASMDFQWSGARLVAHRVDPWKTYLEGDPGHDIIMTQDPNYLHELYVLMLPLGRLGFDAARAWWCAANVVFLAISIVLVARLYRLSTEQSVLLCALMFMSGPVRVAMANGQQSLFVLLCFALAFTVHRSLPRGAAFGVGFVKYSFAPVIVLMNLFRLRWAVLVSMALPIVAGLLIVWRMTGTKLSTLAVEPFRVAHLAVWPGYGDLMTAIQLSLRQLHAGGGGVFMLSSLLALAGALCFAVFLTVRRFEEGSEMALIALSSLVCFMHSIYDYVFLIFPLAILLQGRFRSRRTLIAAWCAMLYLLFFGIIQTYSRLYTPLAFVLTNLLAVSVLTGMIVAQARTLEPSPTLRTAGV